MVAVTIRGIPPDRKDGCFGHHSGCAVFAGDHQRSAPAGIYIQQRRAGRTGQLFLFPRSRLLLLPRLDGGLHVFFSYPPFEEKPHSGQPEKEDHTVCYRLRNGSVRDLVSVGAAGCTPVVRRYECDVLPIICGNL